MNKIFYNCLHYSLLCNRSQNWQCFHYPFPVNGFYIGESHLITHSQYHCTIAHKMSSNHTLNHHKSTSNSSSTTNYSWLTSYLRCNSDNCVIKPNVFKISPRHGHAQKHVSRVRYPASQLARWLNLQKTHHVTATQLVHRHANYCLAKRFNICPNVACGIAWCLSIKVKKGKGIPVTGRGGP
jgi:hypothetical protein